MNNSHFFKNSPNLIFPSHVNKVITEQKFLRYVIGENFKREKTHLSFFVTSIDSMKPAHPVKLDIASVDNLLSMLRITRTLNRLCIR